MKREVERGIEAYFHIPVREFTNMIYYDGEEGGRNMVGKQENQEFHFGHVELKCL